MWTLSGFSDEIDKDFATQCEVVTGLGLKYIEIRSAWGTNILDLDADQLADVQRILAEHGLQVSSIGSPIGKIKITDDFGPRLNEASGQESDASSFIPSSAAARYLLYHYTVKGGDDASAVDEECSARPVRVTGDDARG